jgi:hypothetical protein
MIPKTKAPPQGRSPPEKGSDRARPAREYPAHSKSRLTRRLGRLSPPYRTRGKTGLSSGLDKYYGCNPRQLTANILTLIRACVMRFGMRLGYDWRMDTIRFTSNTPKSKPGDWPRCEVHRKRDGQPCRARALANGRCKHHGELSVGPRIPAGKVRAVANLKQCQNT